MQRGVPAPSDPDARLGRRLVLDEIFDLSLYRALLTIAPAGLHSTLEALISDETRHVAFWQKFFGLEHLTRLDIGRRLRLALIITACRLLGASAIHIVLEAIEVHGVKKYLDVWQRYADGPLRAAIRETLEDEFKHEDSLVTGEEDRRINPEKVRNVFLGLNDGLVEILGAVSGFFAAFNSTAAVVTAGFTVGVAGALSMAAGPISVRAPRPSCARPRTVGVASWARPSRARLPRARSLPPPWWDSAISSAPSCQSCPCCSARAPCGRPCSRAEP